MMAHTYNAVLVEDIEIHKKPAVQEPASQAKKENRLYKRIEIREKIQFGYHKPNFYGISCDITPSGMSIMSDISLSHGEHIVVSIFLLVVDAKNSENIKTIDVEARVIWVKDMSDGYSMSGIQFNETNEKLVRLYAAKLRDMNNES